MKLVQEHYNDIKHEIESAQLKVEDFSFVKKRGWVTITLINENEKFSFFKKKDYEINPQTQKLEKTISFKYKTNENAVIPGNWKSVIIAMRKWLTVIS